LKLLLALLIALSGLASLVGSFYLTTPQWQGFAVGMAGNLIAVAIGIVLVNQYLESSARKGAVKALLMLSEQAIAAFHNRWVTLCWSKFGRDGYGKIGEEYLTANGKPDALKDEVRRDIYDIYVANPEIQNLVKALDEALAELSRLAGWSLDNSLLEESLKARISVSKLLSVVLDGSVDSRKLITEHVLDIDLFTGAARQRLMELAGVED